MPQRFIQISDPHLSSLENVRARDLINKRFLGYLSWRRKRRFEHRREVLDALLADLQNTQFDQVLVTGDLTHIGLPEEFSQARDWLQQLGTPANVGLVPGNHDACVSSPWNQTFSLWRDYMASDNGEVGFPSLRVRGDIAFIGLSTACPTPPLMASGSLGQDQLDKLPALLIETAERQLFRVVYLHHSPIPGVEKWRKRLTDAAGVRSIIQEHGAELIVHGHGHRARLDWLESDCGTVPVVAAPSASALGLHGADIAHYNHYRVERHGEGWRLQIEQRRYDGTSNFTAADSREILLERSERA
jgi:3',5'-cyclic AMP phosphodiesterase CpdA